MTLFHKKCVFFERNDYLCEILYHHIIKFHILTEFIGGMNTMDPTHAKKCKPHLYLHFLRYFLLQDLGPNLNRS